MKKWIPFLFSLLFFAACSSNPPAHVAYGPERVTHVQYDKTTVERGQPSGPLSPEGPSVPPPSPDSTAVQPQGKWVLLKTRFLFSYPYPLQVFIGPAIRPIPNPLPPNLNGEAVGAPILSSPKVPERVNLWVWETAKTAASFNICALPGAYDGTPQGIVNQRKCQEMTISFNPELFHDGIQLSFVNRGFGPFPDDIRPIGRTVPDPAGLTYKARHRSIAEPKPAVPAPIQQPAFVP